MRNKKLAALITTAVLAGALGTGSILASAGTVENKPAGDGLLTATNEINSTNFKVLEQNEGDANAYKPQKASDYTVNYNDGEWQEMLVGTPVPKETMAKPGATVTLQYKLTGGLTNNGAQLKIVPGASSLTESHTFGYILTGGNNGIARVASDRTSATANDPVSQLIAHHAGDAKHDFDVNGNIGWQAYSWSSSAISDGIATYGAMDFRITMTINENNWVDVKLERGFFDQWQRWAPGATVTNWAPYDGTHDFYTNVYARYVGGLQLDGASLSVSYQEGETTKTETLFETDMDDETKVIVASGAEAKPGCFIARGLEYAVHGASGLAVTNPAAGTGIVTRAALQTDKSLALNFKMEAQMILSALAADQKAGFAFGFANSRKLEGAHKYFYFTVKDGKVVFGGEEINAEGGANALFEEVEVAGAAVGADAAAIPVKFEGKGNKMEISVGTNEKIVLDNFDPNGFFAILHKGEGDLTYMLKDNLTMTGYQFKENEEGAETVTSNFTGNYINPEKFQMASGVAPDSHMIATDKTSHALTGITAENGKLGFYGTSTNTRILTTKKYSDFVMQFDYISVPVQQRGALVLAGNRPSAAYLLFGMKEGGLPLDDSGNYVIGINEGIAAIDFYGNNETVISSLGMATKCGFETKGISKVVETTTPDELSIPYYKNNGGYDASKPDNNVEKWYNPDPTAAGTVYSMYNKTTRVKLICVDNNVALFMAEVDAATGNIKGEYIKIGAFKAVDTEGYVGIASDSPAYFEMDNFAVIPVSREDALKFAASGEELTASFVADMAPADMANDPIPTPLDKPVLTADATAKKVTWTAVEGAKDYDVTVKLGSETVLEKTVSGLEIDLSSLTANGTYKVTVLANPENASEHQSSRSTIDYVVGGSTNPGDSSSGTSSSDSASNSSASSGGTSSGGTTSSGCGSLVGGGLSLIAMMGAAFAVAKRKKN